jgi:hypothetical protein
MTNVCAAIVGFGRFGFRRDLVRDRPLSHSPFLIVVPHDPAAIYGAGEASLSPPRDAARPDTVRASYRFRWENTAGALSQLVLTL